MIPRRLSLDLLRIFAAVYVTIFHWAGGGWYSQGLKFNYPTLTTNQDMNPLVACGWIGVDIFFVISGFVVLDSISHRSFLQFAKARFLRLIPTYWLITILTFLISFATLKNLEFELMIKSLLGLNYLEGQSPFIPAAWTLGVEIEFYILASLIFLMNPLRARWQLFCWIYLAFAWFLQQLGFESILLIAVWQFGPLFILGISLRLIEDKKTVSGNLLILFSSLLSIRGLQVRLVDWNSIPSSTALIIASLVIAGIVLIAILKNAQSNSNLKSAKAISAITFTSQLTYPFYLIHESFGEGVISMVYHLTKNVWVSWAFGLAICLLLSTLVLRWANWIAKRFRESRRRDVKV
jgi:peptidoglycan/LPS O-acetylase OafA/YrhL